jgi:hypothetical protein
VRWKEPRALAAADQTAPRAHQRRGRRTVRRRVSGQCAEPRAAGGSLIPHAGAIRPLMIPMIEATFRTPAVAVTGGRDRSLPAGGATRARAVRVATIAGDTDRKEAVTATARLLAKWYVHGVGAASAPTGRTAQTVAQQTGRPRRLGARGSHEGPEVQSGPSPSACSGYAICPRPRDSEEAVDGGAPMDAQNAPTAAWKSRPEREIPTPPTAIICFLITRTDRNDRRGKSRFLRFHVVSDSGRHRDRTAGGGDLGHDADSRMVPQLQS